MNDLHGIVFACRSDANLGELTRPRNTCSLPFGGRYRLIDFMLSNYVNAGITDVGVIVHQSYQSLLDHVLLFDIINFYHYFVFRSIGKAFNNVFSLSLIHISIAPFFMRKHLMSCPPISRIKSTSGRKYFAAV